MMVFLDEWKQKQRLDKPRRDNVHGFARLDVLVNVFLKFRQAL